MKEKLKYIIAVLAAGTVGLGFVPFVKIGTLRLSFLEIFKTGLGFYTGTEAEELLFSAVRTYTESSIWGIAGVVLAILLGAFLIAILPGRIPYVVGMISSILDGAALGGIFFLLCGSLKEMEKTALLVGKENAVELQILTFLIFAVCYVFLFLLSLIGILLWSRGKEDAEPEMEEVFGAEEETIAMPYMEDTFPEYETEKMEFPGQTEQMLKEELFEEEQEKERAAFIQEQEESGKDTERFSGEICGEAGLHSGKRYALKGVPEIFFLWAEESAVLSTFESPQALVSVRYEAEEGQYCVAPFAVKTVFLESGQPLGKGRKYYVPRGTKIYIKNKENIFTLV